jgi:hypothetical protein
MAKQATSELRQRSMRNSCVFAESSSTVDSDLGGRGRGRSIQLFSEYRKAANLYFDATGNFITCRYFAANR